jgi:hypothetical protein
MTICVAAQSLAPSAAVMAGVTPLTSPPLVLSTFDPAILAGHDLVFFKLHGMSGQPYWYGDSGITACSAEQIGQANLAGALVFVANCWGGEDAPMVQALRTAGALAVVTGTGVNFAGQRWPAGADVLGRVWRVALSLGATAEMALALGRAAAKIHSPQLRVDLDSFAVIGERKARLNGKATKRG